jgi:enoyl-CoA hydratase/carnithine racemase
VIHYERRGPAALVTIDRPERHNAIDGATASALLEAFQRFCEDDADVLVRGWRSKRGSVATGS